MQEKLKLFCFINQKRADVSFQQLNIKKRKRLKKMHNKPERNDDNYH